jgi:hypothetical protein
MTPADAVKYLESDEAHRVPASEEIRARLPRKARRFYQDPERRLTQAGAQVIINAFAFANKARRRWCKTTRDQDGRFASNSTRGQEP